MALERQITFKTNVTKTIDTEVENFLQTAEVDLAAIQVVIDGGNGVKTATLTYGSREAIKAVYEQQGRVYSDADAVTYCHVKDIVLPFTGDLDNEVNNFLADENVSAISISRYFTPANQGAFILYINVAEQKEKMDAKKLEMEKAQEELAQKLATRTVKNVELNTDDTVEKYADMTTETAEECQNCDDHCDCAPATTEVIEEATVETEAKSKKGIFNKRNK